MDLLTETVSFRSLVGFEYVQANDEIAQEKMQVFFYTKSLSGLLDSLFVS